MELLLQGLGHHAMVRDLIEFGAEDTPQYDSYEDELQNATTFLILDKEPEETPEWGNQYANAEILLPSRNRMARRLCGTLETRC